MVKEKDLWFSHSKIENSRIPRFLNIQHSKRACIFFINPNTTHTTTTTNNNNNAR